MRENPVISDWVHVSGGSTEGTLGRWLAQRQAALRGCWRRGLGDGFRLFRVVPRSTEHALCQKTIAVTNYPSWLITHCDLALERDCFLFVRIELVSAQRILTRLAAIASFKENFTE